MIRSRYIKKETMYSLPVLPLFWRPRTSEKKMKLIVTLTLLAVSHARIIRPGCDADGVSINDIYYEKEVLRDNLDSPYQMVIDYNTNTLFFSYTANSKDDVFKSVALNLKTNEFKIIPGIKGGFAAAVDNNNHKVYLGGRNGIYEYDYAKQQAIHVMKGPSIWQMFAKDKLYYTAYPNERVYAVEGDNAVIIPELKRTMVLLVALDNNNNMYFTNSSGLFYFNKSDKEITQVGEYVINSFTTDIEGNLYFSTPTGFYKIINNQMVNQLFEINDVLGVVVDEDNHYIYGAGNKIIRLKPTNNMCSKMSRKF